MFHVSLTVTVFWQDPCKEPENSLLLAGRCQHSKLVLANSSQVTPRGGRRHLEEKPNFLHSLTCINNTGSIMCPLVNQAESNTEWHASTTRNRVESNSTTCTQHKSSITWLLQCRSNLIAKPQLHVQTLQPCTGVAHAGRKQHTGVNALNSLYMSQPQYSYIFDYKAPERMNTVGSPLA